MAAPELFSNHSQTTLNGAINNSVTSLVVISSSGFPSATGQFRILIDSEIFIVTNVSGTTWTVTRGAESTTAASHNNGSTVTMVITNGGLIQFRADGNMSGTTSAMPAAGAAGRLFFPTDDVGFSRDNGSTWTTYGPIYLLTPPDDSLFSWVNQRGGSDIITVEGKSIYLLSLGSNGATSLHMRVKAVPTAPYTLTIGFIPFIPGSNNNMGGICLYESGSGKIIGMYYEANQQGNVDPDCYMKLTKWTNTGAVSADYNFGHGNNLLASNINVGPVSWWRITDDNSNRYWSVSADGHNFISVASQSRTDFLTPDKVGFFLNPNGSNGLASGILVISWLEE